MKQCLNRAGHVSSQRQCHFPLISELLNLFPAFLSLIQTLHKYRILGVIEKLHRCLTVTVSNLVSDWQDCVSDCLSKLYSKNKSLPFLSYLRLRVKLRCRAALAFGCCRAVSILHCYWSGNSKTSSPCLEDTELVSISSLKRPTKARKNLQT